mmetsp:Transcript_2140/g.3718  ORF Transcript_2140/g.3718 Transcript_2140/m.3718 type:complete len:94 (+) Transcript_2140:385-666(+)
MDRRCPQGSLDPAVPQKLPVQGFFQSRSGWIRVNLPFSPDSKVTSRVGTWSQGDRCGRLFQSIDSRDTTTNTVQGSRVVNSRSFLPSICTNGE